MKLLLDTSMLISLRKGSKKAIEALKSYRFEAGEILISMLTYYELLVGAYYLFRKYHDVRELLWLEEILRWVRMAELADDKVRLAAMLKTETLIAGREIPDIDILVACSGGEETELLTYDRHQKEVSSHLEKYRVRVVFLGET